MASPASSLNSPSQGATGGVDSGSDNFMPSQMAGGDGQSQPPSAPGSDPKAMIQNALMQVQSVETVLTSLSKQFPTAAPEIRAALKAVRSISQSIVSNPGLKEPSAPSGMA